MHVGKIDDYFFDVDIQHYVHWDNSYDFRHFSSFC